MDNLGKTFVTGKASVLYWQSRGFNVSNYYFLPYVPVGRRQPNAWGIYDMGGTEWEAMLDWYRGKWLSDVSKMLGAALLRNPQLREDGVKDPLMAESGTGSRYWMVRAGFGLKHDDSCYKSSSSAEWHPFIRRGILVTGKEKDKDAWPRFIFRPVIAPDLLQERGITPSNLGK